jgi:PAS domain-containing protein
MSYILDYAKHFGFTAYTSTLKEAWRLSISGLSASVIRALRTHEEPPELQPDEDLTEDPIAQFGMVEAQRHRERGISLGMFLSLMKYYRQAYLDLIHAQELSVPEKEGLALFVSRVFDRIEIAFCVEWTGAKKERALQEMQMNNRLMTNEKNRYLTIFESIPNPIILLNRNKRVENMNLAAVGLFRDVPVAGSQYYCESRDRHLETPDTRSEGSMDAGCFGSGRLVDLLPWLVEEVDRFLEDDALSREFEQRVEGETGPMIYRVKLTKNLDISGKFEGTVIILEDITSLKQAIEEVKTLRGFVPICSSCKNIRDDRGFWQKVEHYVEDHSEAQFSHSICPDCMKKLYPTLGKKDIR